MDVNHYVLPSFFVLLFRLVSYSLIEVRTGMSEFAQASLYLPKKLRSVMMGLPKDLTARVQEIRLRADAPVSLSVPGGEWQISISGQPIQGGFGNTLICSRSQLDECFLMLCEYSVHTHQQELSAGFITAPNGCRAGIAGTAVVDSGKIVSFRNITSICLRVARRHDGCANELLSVLTSGDRIQSTLVCGEPSSGKSSILRDLARQLSTGSRGQIWKTAVVDERGELSGNGSLGLCDVLKNCPKAMGIQQAIRCLAPDIVIFDELGTTEEARAVIEGLNSGVAAVASAHCKDIESLCRRPPLVAALESRAFDIIVFLEGRRSPGRLSRIMKVGDILNEICGNDIYFSCGCMGRDGGIVSPQQARISI